MTGRPGRADAIAIASIIALWVAMAALVNPIADFPLDWSTGSRRQRRYPIIDHGHFWIRGPRFPICSRSLTGAVAVLPDLRVFVHRLADVHADAGPLPKLALYCAAIRRLGGEPRLALVGAAAVAVNPLWFSLANGFMTDVPFLSVTILSLLLLVWGRSRFAGATALCRARTGVRRDPDPADRIVHPGGLRHRQAAAWFGSPLLAEAVCR